VKVLLDSRQVGRRLRIDPSPRLPVSHSLAPVSQTACYLLWLKVSVALRYVSNLLWAPEAWHEVRQHIPWLVAEQARLRKAGWFN